MNQFLVSTTFKQGHTASMTYRVQRSYGPGWDIRADHPDVPAIFISTLKWEEAQPKNLHVDFFRFSEFHVMYGFRNLQFILVIWHLFSFD